MSTAADQQCHENWRRTSVVFPSFLAASWERRFNFVWLKRRTNSGNSGEPIRDKKKQVGWKRQAWHTCGLCSDAASHQKRWWHPLMNSAAKRFSYDETKSTKEKNKSKKSKRMHITSRVYYTRHGRSTLSRTISKWQWARITLHALFTKTILSRKRNLTLRCTWGLSNCAPASTTVGVCAPVFPLCAVSWSSSPSSPPNMLSVLLWSDIKAAW